MPWIAIVLAVAGVVAACGDRLSGAQLEWCSDHGTAVARAALAAGTDFTSWRQGSVEDYRQACEMAFADAG
jgi:hypothetical protein